MTAVVIHGTALTGAVRTIRSTGSSKGRTGSTSKAVTGWQLGWRVGDPGTKSPEPGWPKSTSETSTSSTIQLTPLSSSTKPSPDASKTTS